MNDKLICSCERVYESTIRKAIEEGSMSFSDLQKTTGLGRSCGNCRPIIDRILKEQVSDDTDNQPIL